MEKNIINDSLNWILARGNSGGKHSLEKIKRLLEKFDNPQDKLKVIHVAGTNGKGSVSNYLAKTISKKYSCGLFTSPYMERINEAVSISGQEISDSDFCKYIEKLKKPVEDLDKEGLHNTYFEVLTALMYLYFYEKNVDYSVVEVGLGGSLDSTNIIKKPIACVISTISYDHTNILGDTLEEIAGNKAGIIKNGSNVFVYPQKEEAMKVIEEKIEKENAKLHKFDYSEVEIISLNDSYNEFSFRNFKNVKTNLLGKHQVYNASLALMVLDFFKDQLNLTDDLIKEAIFESKNAELVKARQTYEEEIETAKKAMDEAVELVKKVLDLDAVLEAHGKVKSKHRGGGTIDREAFRSAQRVIAKEHEKLLAIGYYSVGMDFIENANFNRPDRDDTSHIRMSDICTLKEYKKREEGE